MSYVNVDLIIWKSIKMADTQYFDLFFPFNGTVLRYLLQNDMTFVKLSIINKFETVTLTFFLSYFQGQL